MNLKSFSLREKVGAPTRSVGQAGSGALKRDTLARMTDQKPSLGSATNASRRCPLATSCPGRGLLQAGDLLEQLVQALIDFLTHGVLRRGLGHVGQDLVDLPPIDLRMLNRPTNRQANDLVLEGTR